MKNNATYKKIMLLDGTGLVYRAYYAFITRPLTTTRGENTSAIFGFLKVLIQIIRDFKPDKLLAAFDLSRDTFRREIFNGYKANRQETPPDLKKQIPVIIEILNLMRIPILEMEGYEADDIIGSISEKMKNDNEIYIISGDKDLLQLVGGNVKAIRPQHGLSVVNLMDNIKVKEALGVNPDQIPDYLSIVGDSSDNIPGVKGIGEKGAIQLISTYSSLENIYLHIDDIKGAMQKKLIEGRENAFLSKRLAQIKSDIIIDDTYLSDNLDLNQILNNEVIKKLEHYQITSIVKDIKKLTEITELPGEEKGLFKDGTAALEQNSDELYRQSSLPLSRGTLVKALEGSYSLITKKEEIASLFNKIMKNGCISLDTETTSANPTDADLIGISISLEEGEGVFIPVLYNTQKEFDKDFVIQNIKPILENQDIKKIGQNVKYEIEIFNNEGIEIKGISFDTMLAAYLINPTRTHNNLESLVQEYLGFKKRDYKSVLKDILKKDKTLLDASIEDVVNYACGDSDSALRLKNKLESLIEENNLTGAYYEIEMPLVPVLAAMERNGVKIDTSRLKELSLEFEKSIQELEEKIYHLAGKSFNINSPVQLSKILFEELQLDSVKRTDGGKESTDEEVLKVLANIHPLPAEILKYRTYAKLKGTYVDALPELISPRTGRIHTSFNQTITATGRLSSSDPNLQNIPIRDEIGRKIREAFVADEGNILISADYSQIELRVLAHFCGDENMKKAFSENLDIHSHTASLIFGIPENEVTEEQRRRAKSVNFGIIYGLQAFGLSRQIGITMTEAKLFINSYFESFPKVKAFVDKVLTGVSASGEVRTLSGRYRKFPDLIGKEIKPGGQLNSSQRMALNTKIQGSGADIIKIAMIKLHEYIKKNNLRSKLILQIHDELVIESPMSEVENMKTAVKNTMEKAYLLDVPLVVDVGTGKNWCEAH